MGSAYEACNNFNILRICLHLISFLYRAVGAPAAAARPPRAGRPTRRAAVISGGNANSAPRFSAFGENLRSANKCRRSDSVNGHDELHLRLRFKGAVFRHWKRGLS
ncbi:hypothetical protein EVAR_13427_1 [Eumeta japonica]|uniref:Uncharacterized protein n=1 Tax=Eumeta variegata TaxID=151549 RepID=A0A4C1V619_EUMVA|nr:hypothetical protein EVAR_13427_1 [Eumeta japonica]